MKNVLTKATAALAMAGALMATAPAQARPGGYYGYGGYNHGWSRGHHWRHHHDDDTGLAIGAGIIGLALGAAILSDHSRDDRGYYYNQRGYYDGYDRYDGDRGYGDYYNYYDGYPGYGY